MLRDVRGRRRRLPWRLERRQGQRARENGRQRLDDAERHCRREGWSRRTRLMSLGLRAAIVRGRLSDFCWRRVVRVVMQRTGAVLTTLAARLGRRLPTRTPGGGTLREREHAGDGRRSSQEPPHVLRMLFVSSGVKSRQAVHVSTRRTNDVDRSERDERRTLSLFAPPPNEATTLGQGLALKPATQTRNPPLNASIGSEGRHLLSRGSHVQVLPGAPILARFRRFDDDGVFQAQIDRRVRGVATGRSLYQLKYFPRNHVTFGPGQPTSNPDIPMALCEPWPTRVRTRAGHWRHQGHPQHPSGYRGTTVWIWRQSTVLCQFTTRPPTTAAYEPRRSVGPAEYREARGGARRVPRRTLRPVRPT
jgi:hypothetical protein